MSSDSDELYGEAYYRSYFGAPFPYSRDEPHWLKFFGDIARHLVQDIGPSTVLDAGCAMGFLVEKLREYGVEAKGFDISEYAISQAVDEIKDHVKVGSITNPDLYSKRFDLVLCFEVLEHLPPEQASVAVANLCNWGNMVLFTSTPDHYEEPTHFNVQQPGYWAEKFAQHDFIRVHNYDATYVAPWAMLFKREVPIWSSVVRSYEDQAWLKQREAHALRRFSSGIQQKLDHTQKELHAAQSTLQSQAEQIAHQSEQIARQSEQIARQSEQLQQAERRVAQRTKQLSQAKKQIAEQVEKLHQAEERLAHLAEHSQHLQGELDQLKNSLAFRLRNTLLPTGSLPQRIYRRLRHASKVLFAFGPRELAKRTREHVTEESTDPEQIAPPAEAVSKRPPLYKGQRKIHYRRYGVPRYDAAFANHVLRTEPTFEELDQQVITSRTWVERPLISIVTPVYNPPLDLFKDTLRSIQAQTYENWEWRIADASSDENVWKYISEAAHRDPRIKPIQVAENKGISGNTNIAIEAAQGEFVALLDHDDVLTENALFEVVRMLHEHPDADLIYSDEDKINEAEERVEVFFKPDWSPELMYCANLITHLSVIRRSIFDRIGLLNPETDGAQDWDIFLRVSEVTDRIHHIPRVLYHWRKAEGSTAQSGGNKPYIANAQTRALIGHLRRLGLQNPEVIFQPEHPIHSVYPHVRWQQKTIRSVSIVIPSKDHADVLGQCLETIFMLTTYPDFEVIVVDTGSVEPETQTLYDDYADMYPNFRVVPYDGEFNFSRACNIGADNAEGDLLLFLNNDTEVRQSNWLQLMAMWFEIDGIGIVGPKLYYPDMTIQHAGVIIGMGGLAAHVFSGTQDVATSIFGTSYWYRNVSAVTGACLLVSRDVFNKVGGWDENYRLNYSDVEFCIQAQEAGYRIVFTPQVSLIHHESVTHARRIPRSDFERASERWKPYFEDGDPYFNPNLSVSLSIPHLRLADWDTPEEYNKWLMDNLPHKEIIVLPDDVQHLNRAE